ncbi:MAG: DUF1854 domain-containing protein [Gallionella sp.]|jgi:hypothetical protein
MSNFQLTRNAAGRLVFTSDDGQTHEGVVPVRAFPILAPDECISLADSDGHELAWLEKLSELPDDIRELIMEELACREFTPEISRISQVSSFATPSIWQVETNRGATFLSLKAEDHIRRLSPTALLITDSHGVSFLIRDLEQLDAHSRKLLDRFL